MSEPTSFESIAAIDLEEITKEKMNFIVNSYINNAEWDPISCGKQLQFAETLARFVKAIHEYKEKKVVSRFSLFWGEWKTHKTDQKTKRHLKIIMNIFLVTLGLVIQTPEVA